MKLTVTPTNGWRLREAPFAFQQTFVTPLDNLPTFVDILLSPFEIEEATIRIEQIIFKPGELIWYLRGLGFITDEGELNRTTLFAENAKEAATLLECILGQWTDFSFVPSPKTFAIYADHDEYTTVFTSDEEVLNQLRSQMQAKSIKAVDDWQWIGPRSPGKPEEGN